MSRGLVLFLFVSVPLAGQVAAPDRAVTVTASRSTSATPDLAVYGVQILTRLDTSLDDVLAVVSGAGITAADFNSLNTTQRVEPEGRGTVNRDYLQWDFTFKAPLANLKGALAQLTSLAAAVKAKNNGMSVSYSLSGTQASIKALSALNCGAVELLADARAQAQRLAAGAGLPIGQVVSVSGASMVTPAVGAFSSGVVQPSCALTVTFAQTGPNTITIAASRNLTVTPDQVVFQITVRTNSTASLDDAVALLAGTPLTAANLTGAGNPYVLPAQPGSVQWAFEWVLPLAKIKDANTVLAAAKQQAEQRNGAGAFTYQATRAQTSESAARQACDVTALVNDARTEAGRIASAAGINVGPIAGVSDSAGGATVPALALRSGTFAASIGIFDPAVVSYSGFLLGSPTAFTLPPACGITVVFRLIG